jgi:3-deoxy-D-manno-octulosonic-acid transferase
VCGAPVLFGPNHGKASRIAAEFLRLGAGIEIADGDALPAAARTALTDPDTRDRLAAAGERLLTLHRGAAERQARRIRDLVA